MVAPDNALPFFVKKDTLKVVVEGAAVVKCEMSNVILEVHDGTTIPAMTIANMMRETTFIIFSSSDYQYIS